jgi:hypothetical protein
VEVLARIYFIISGYSRESGAGDRETPTTLHQEMGQKTQNGGSFTLR